MSENAFFQRNTISRFDIENTPSTSKIRSKRASSVSQLNTNPGKFQHREVFDSKIYQKVNFFKLGLQQLRKEQPADKSRAMQQLQQIGVEWSQLANQKGVAHLAQNLNSYWGLLPEWTGKEQLVEKVTQLVGGVLKRLLERAMMIEKARGELEQQVIRLQNDLRVARKESTITPQDMKLTMRRSQKKEEKDYRQKYLAVDFQLKKEMLKVEQLQQRARQQMQICIQLQQMNSALLKQKEQQRSYKQNMEYRVKRLKEQLQVANIIKEQNLADKMKYIMNW